MQTTDSVDKKLWKRHLQDALLELAPPSLSGEIGSSRSGY